MEVQVTRPFHDVDKNRIFRVGEKRPMDSDMAERLKKQGYVKILDRPKEAEADKPKEKPADKKSKKKE